MNTEFEHGVFELFRQWTKAALIKFPECNFEIVDETILIDEVKDSFEKAIEALQLKEDNINRKHFGYDYAFLTSYVKSNLNIQWHHNYIEKQTQEYKKYVVFKAMEQFFRVDTLTVERLTKLYYHILYSDVNLMNIEEQVKHKTIISEEVEQINQPKDNPILQMINNEITDYMNDYLTTDKLNFMPDIRSCFPYSSITNNFKNYHEL